MHHRPLTHFLLLLTLLISGCSSAPSNRDGSLLVATAANVQPAFAQLARSFEDETGIAVTLVVASTGTLAQQIENGAPYDLFAAADVEHVDQLIEQGQLLGDSRQIYARGRLVLVVNRASGRQVTGLADLADPSLGPIAIANPLHAPYGLAAQEALVTSGLWPLVEDRLIWGESVRQALQFVQAGDAPVGIVAQAIADVPEVSAILIPADLHAPIEQAMAICERSSRVQDSRRFLAYVGGPEGRTVLQHYGYQVPGEFWPAHQ